MNKEKYKNLVETLPKESEELWFEYNLEVNKILQENQELKKQLEEKTKIGVADHKYASKCEDKVVTFENQQKKFIDYLENEKYRLAGSVSHIYEDSLGKTRLVNEDIFNELDKILSKYIGIIEGKDEK